MMTNGTRRASALSAWVCAVAMILGAADSAHALVTRPILKSFFQSGDKPTQSQFSSLIDSMLTYSDDRYLLGLKVYNPSLTYLPGDTVIYQRMTEGQPISAAPGDYVDPRGLVADFSDFQGQFGFLPVKLGNSTGTFYGYLQILMESNTPARSLSIETPDPPIYVQYLVYNEIPNAPLTATAVPEPIALTLLLPSAMLMWRRRR
jgi:hypothetical protein